MKPRICVPWIPGSVGRGLAAISTQVGSSRDAGPTSALCLRGVAPDDVVAAALALLPR
jgi:hypothetical protein